jgi:hypothetical protein
MKLLCRDDKGNDIELLEISVYNNQSGTTIHRPIIRMKPIDIDNNGRHIHDGDKDRFILHNGRLTSVNV